MRGAVAIRSHPADDATARGLLAAYRHELDERFGGFDEALSPSAGPNELAPPGGTVLVLYEGRRPVGCGGLKTLAPGVGEIKRMYVVPAARGRGHARRLLEALEDAAPALGHRRVRLDTAASMPEARTLYESAGYRPVADYNANPYAAFWFEKAIAPSRSSRPWCCWWSRR
ncbi:MAG: GNAT family N-acetyltransferase [Solirubrobacteraceae bacterium]